MCPELSDRWCGVGLVVSSPHLGEDSCNLRFRKLSRIVDDMKAWPDDDRAADAGAGAANVCVFASEGACSPEVSEECNAPRR